MGIPMEWKWDGNGRNFGGFMEMEWIWIGMRLTISFLALKTVKYAAFCGNGMEMGDKLKNGNGTERIWIWLNGMEWNGS